MALDSTAGKNAAASGFTSAAPYAAVYSSAPSGGAAGTEISGVARQAVTWSAPSNGVSTATATFTGFSDNTAVVAAGLHSASTAGTYEGGVTVTSRTPGAGGSLTVTFTYTQS